MPELQKNKINYVQESNPWMMWVIFFSAILIFASLWLIAAPEWHLGIGLITLLILWLASTTPFRTLTLIVSLVFFLALLQLLFSPFMRDLFIRSIEGGFKWEEWQYLLFAVEKLAWPLMIVSVFSKKLNSPIVAAYMTQLLSPLKWLGIRINGLQTVLLLALRFMPSLQKEWHRLSYFQTYFSSRKSRKSLIQRLNYGQGVLRALISHTISRAVTTGDIFALRGLPTSPELQLHKNMWLPLIIWLPLGFVSLVMNPQLFYTWIVMTVWLGLTALAINEGQTV